MIIIGIVLSFVGLAYLCWLLFALAVYALPFFAGVSVGFAAYHGGSGPVAAVIIGAIAASVVLVLGQIAFARLSSPLMRAALALLFAVPAAVAGYHAARGLAHLVVPAEAWRDAIAIAGATIVATTAFMRMWLSPRPMPSRALLPAQRRLIRWGRTPARRELAISEERLSRPLSPIATHDLCAVSGALRPYAPSQRTRRDPS